MSAASRTRWGYHQLTKPWAHRLVRGAGICPGDLVLDVGAGRGVLTAELVSAGARVVAVELHPARAKHLRGRFAGQPVVVVGVDALDLRLPHQPFRVVANLPFAVSAAVPRRLVGPSSRLVSADLVVPAQVAARWAAGQGPGEKRWSRTFAAQVAVRLPPAAFRPPATMATSVLRIERHRLGGGGPNAPPQLGSGLNGSGAPRSPGLRWQGPATLPGCPRPQSASVLHFVLTWSCAQHDHVSYR